jgi:hypothetical protein
MTTLTLNRSLLRFQRAENLQSVLNHLIEQELPGHRRSSTRLTGLSSEYEMEAYPKHSWESQLSYNDELYRLG